jgi:hypothetical protein
MNWYNETEVSVPVMGSWSLDKYIKPDSDLEQKLSALCAEALLPPKQTLTLTCSKCTQQGFFQAVTRQEATDQAASQGWKQRGERTVCPKCPA